MRRAKKENIEDVKQFLADHIDVNAKNEDGVQIIDPDL